MIETDIYLYNIINDIDSAFCFWEGIDALNLVDFGIYFPKAEFELADFNIHKINIFFFLRFVNKQSMSNNKKIL